MSASLPAWRTLAAEPALSALRQYALRQHGLHGGPVAVAFSGGADSTALLLAALHVWGPERLHALHVHHGLQADADVFAAHVRQVCASWGVACSILPVAVRVARGDSVEDVARSARYAALTESARSLSCGWLLLGHQADDQAESLLLALLRGAGPKGLAAMPEVKACAGVQLARPLLECTAAALREMLDAQGIVYMRDAMNVDPAYRRSRIRHELLPVLAALEPAWRSTLARSARLCAQAAASIAELAQQDMATCATQEGLHLAALRALSDARLSEVLRLWLLEAGVRSSQAQIVNLLRQVRATARGATALGVRIGGALIERRKGWLVLRHE